METHARRRLRALTLLLVLAATMADSRAADFSIFGRHAADVAAETLAGFEGVEARLLRRDSRGLVVELRLPAGATINATRANYTAEWFVLAGQLQLEHGSNGELLVKQDYVRVPSRESALPLRAIQASTMLLFLDPPRSSDGEKFKIVRTGANDWTAGMVSARDTGVALKLQVRDLYHEPQSGQRTWLLRAGADLTLPWERHRTIEEGYLISGDYRLFECLEGREQSFDYRAGGYFYRAPGIVHGGPRSGSSGEIVMLLRTPDKLTVEFLPSCAASTKP
jgi:quercetin dioxygenase-like cupin family protein